MRARPLISMAQEPQISSRQHRVVGDGHGLLAVAGDGVGRDLHQRRRDVHVRLVGDLELLPRRLLVGGELAFDLYDYGFIVCHLAFSPCTCARGPDAFVRAR